MDVYALVRSIRENRWSRNRNFDEHEGPAGAEARRLHRFLRGVERDVRSAGVVRVRRRDGGYTVSMGFPEVRLTRSVALTDEEHALLAEDPQLARLLCPSE
jgi:hypothetical protein